MSHSLMKSIRGGAVCLAAAVLSTAASGCLFAHVRTPMGTVNRTISVQDKSGSSSCDSLLWLVAWGDCGIQAAAKDGNLTTLEYADEEIMSVCFGLWIHSTTIVYGK
jgi:hypothetical protein